MDEYRSVTILDVLGVDLCARAIWEYVPVKELARSERVSKGWQDAVLHYLKTCRVLNYKLFFYPLNNIFSFNKTNRRTISFHIDEHSLPLVHKALDKWGPYIMKVITDIGRKDTYLDIIVSKCPNLEQIEIIRPEDDQRRPPKLTPIKKLKQLKQIVLQNIFSFSETAHSDLVLGELFQDTTCENITICHNYDITGSFLKLIKPDVLKSLTLTRCMSLRVSNLLSAIDNLRNLQSLKLGESKILPDAHLLLTQMPQLEELTLHGFRYVTTSLGEVWIHAFSQLGNLKRLTLNGTCGRVTDAFLEGLARGYKNLEYLKITGSGDSITAHGVTALCRRSPSARTMLHCPLSEDNQDFVFLLQYKPVGLYKELAALGCVELTLEWFAAASRDPRGRELPLNPTAGCRPKDPRNQLTLIIY